MCSLSDKRSELQMQSAAICAVRLAQFAPETFTGDATQTAVHVLIEGCEIEIEHERRKTTDAVYPALTNGDNSSRIPAGKLPSCARTSARPKAKRL